MGTVSFEIKSKDLAGRIGQVELNGKIVETPALMPVFNPQSSLITVDELSELFDCKVLMANSYMLLKNEELKEKILDEGIHKLFGFGGLIATDSGSYQLMNYGMVEATNREVIEFQEKIGSDIGSFLDIPTLPDAFKPRAKAQVDETLKRSVEAEDAKFLVNAGIQGGKYLDLRAECAKSIGERFPLVAVGGIVPLMESYRFAELVDVIATVKQNIPTDRIVHAFGLGHPMLFALAVALGCDFFDSASYALFAKAGRYMTVEGTKKIDELDYISCTCPVCVEHGIRLKKLYGEDKTRALALHNLYVCFSEIEAVKQSIRDGRLWEHVALRCRSHPEMMRALTALTKHSDWIATLDAVTKNSAIYYTGFETALRPEVVNAKKRLERIEGGMRIPLKPYGEVPPGLLEFYPFGQTLHPENTSEYTFKETALEKLRMMADYQFGKGAGALIPDNAIVKKSRNTGRMRWVYVNKEMFLTIRASDHFLLPKEGYMKLLHENFKYPRLRVVLEDDGEVLACVKEGKSVFAKFVKEVDPELKAGDECLIVDHLDNLIRGGTLHMSPKEIKDFTKGMAVRVR